MKPSEMKKDVRGSIRINKQIKQRLLKKGISTQKIIDMFIDDYFEAGTSLKKKKER